MAKENFPLLPRVINGSIAGVVGVTCVFPIDLVKTRLQNQQIGPNGERMYKSLADCFVKTFRRDGFFGMYRGSGVNLLLITPEKAIKLVGNEFFRHHLKDNRGKLTLPRELLSGAGAGLCQIIVTTPMELLKIQMQDAGRTAAGGKGGHGTVSPPGAQSYSTAPKAQRLTASSIALKLLRDKGMFGLYKGVGATMLRDVTFSAIYFTLFAHLNAVGKRREGSDKAVFYVSFIAGNVAGAVASLSVNPMDVVKTRLQTLTKAEGERHYTGVVNCFTETYKHEGWRAFFKGGACRIMVIAPLFGIAQTVYYIGIGESMLDFVGVKY